MRSCCSASTTLIRPAHARRRPRDGRCCVLTEPIERAAVPARGRAREYRAERGDLDRIAQRRAGAVRLDVVDVAGAHARPRPARGAITACCARPLGAVSPLLGPSWLTAEPRITAWMRSPSRSRVARAA